MIDAAFYIFTTHKNHERIDFIRDTWGKDLKHFYVFTDRDDPRDYFINCSEKDDYPSHIVKNFAALDYALGLSQVKWHIFIGDDTYFYLKNLERFLLTLPNELAIYGRYGYHHPERFIGGGSGIIMNYETLKAICHSKRYKLDMFKYEFSDVSIGALATRVGAKVRGYNRSFFSNPPTFHRVLDPFNRVSFHYIKSRSDFESLHSLSAFQPENPYFEEIYHD